MQERVERTQIGSEKHHSFSHFAIKKQTNHHDELNRTHVKTQRANLEMYEHHP